MHSVVTTILLRDSMAWILKMALPKRLMFFCNEGLCYITLKDLSFSTCIKNFRRDNCLWGVALTRGIPQDTLDNFDLDLYCSKDFLEPIDYDSEPVAKFAGNLEFLGGGIIKRTTNGFTYFNFSKVKTPLVLNQWPRKPTGEVPHH